MRAIMLFGLVVCVASVAYANDPDKDKSTSSSSSKDSAASKNDSESKKDAVKPLNAAETALMNDLHAANLTEVAAGKIADKTSESAAVKKYARMLVKDHGAADRKVWSLAKRKKLTLTSTPRPVGDLEGRKGADFDSAFLTMMVKDHDEAISLVKRGIDTCEDADVHKLLEQTLPVLEQHRSEAEKLQQLAMAR